MQNVRTYTHILIQLRFIHTRMWRGWTYLNIFNIKTPLKVYCQSSKLFEGKTIDTNVTSPPLNTYQLVVITITIHYSYLGTPKKGLNSNIKHKTNTNHFFYRFEIEKVRLVFLTNFPLYSNRQSIESFIQLFIAYCCNRWINLKLFQN